MTIPNEDVRSGPTIGNGVTTSFPFLMSVSSVNDIRVIRQNISTGAQTIETEGVTINTTLTGSPAGSTGGNVVFVSPPSSSYTVTILLNPSLTQETALPLAGTFPSTAVEAMADKVVNIAKRNRDLIQRSLTLLDGDVDGSGRFDANGNRIINLGAPTAGTDAATQSYVQSQIAAAVLDPSVSVSAIMADVLDETTYDAALTLMGAGVVGLPIFKSDSQAGVMTGLGITSVSQALLALSSIASWRSSLQIAQQIPLRNWIVNPDFTVWQNGTTFNSSTPSANANDDNRYSADQWIHLCSGSDIIDLARYSPAVFNDGRSGIAVVQQTDNAKWGLMQILEAQRTQMLRGQQVTLSIDHARNAGDLADFKMFLIEWTGTADDRSAASDPISAWNAATSDPTLAAGWAYVAGASATFTATQTWATASLTVTLPTTPNNLAVLIVTNDGSYTAGATAYFGRANLTKSAVAVPFYPPSHADELRECQRFFAKTFPYSVVPAVNQGYAGALWSRTITDGASNGALMASWRFPVEMLKTPTVTMLNPGSGGASDDWRNDGDTASNTNTVAPVGIGTSGCFLHATTNAVSTDNYAIHATADARL